MLWSLLKALLPLFQSLPPRLSLGFRRPKPGPAREVTHLVFNSYSLTVITQECCYGYQPFKLSDLLLLTLSAGVTSLSLSTSWQSLLLSWPQPLLNLSFKTESLFLHIRSVFLTVQVIPHWPELLEQGLCWVFLACPSRANSILSFLFSGSVSWPLWTTMNCSPWF